MRFYTPELDLYKLLCVLAIALPALAIAIPASHKVDVTLPGEESHEVCLDLSVGEILHYSFDASDLLDFNLHYHGDGKTLYPIRENASSKGEGLFEPTSTKRYCLMWRNSSPEMVELAIRVDVTK